MFDQVVVVVLAFISHLGLAGEAALKSLLVPADGQLQRPTTWTWVLQMSRKGMLLPMRGHWTLS